MRSAEIQIALIQKYKNKIYINKEIQNYRNMNYRNTDIPITEIQITLLQKYKLKKRRNTIYRITEIKTEKKFTQNSKVTQSS